MDEVDSLAGKEHRGLAVAGLPGRLTGSGETASTTAGTNVKSGRPVVP